MRFCSCSDSSASLRKRSAVSSVATTIREWSCGAQRDCARTNRTRVSCRDRGPLPASDRADTGSRGIVERRDCASRERRDARPPVAPSEQAAAMARAFRENFAAPFVQRRPRRKPRSSESPGAAPSRGDALLVAHDGGELLGRVGRAVAQQAVQQEHVEKAHRVRGDADRARRDRGP